MLLSEKYICHNFLSNLRRAAYRMKVEKISATSVNGKLGWKETLQEVTENRLVISYFKLIIS